MNHPVFNGLDDFFNGALSAIHSFRGSMEQIIILFRPAAFYEDLSYAFGFFSYIKVMHLFLPQKEGSQPLFEMYCVVFIRFQGKNDCFLTNY